MDVCVCTKWPKHLWFGCFCSILFFVRRFFFSLIYKTLRRAIFQWCHHKYYWMELRWRPIWHRYTYTGRPFGWSTALRKHQWYNKKIIRGAGSTNKINKTNYANGVQQMRDLAKVQTNEQLLRPVVRPWGGHLTSCWHLTWNAKQKC